MPRKALPLAFIAVAAAVNGGSAQELQKRLLIGDVETVDMAQQQRGDEQEQHLRRHHRREQRSLNENLEILESMLGKEHFDIDRDECLNEVNDDGRAVYGRCDIRRFPYCTGNRGNICFNRVNRQDAFWPDKHPKYYIDYNRVHCYPDRQHNVDFTCSSCSPGRWCMPEGRCILDEKLYHCWDTE